MVEVPHEFSGSCLATLRAAVGAVAAEHYPRLGDAFDVRLLPDDVVLADDDGVAGLSAGCCVEAVVWPQVVARCQLDALEVPAMDCYRINPYIEHAVREERSDFRKAGLLVAAYPDLHDGETLNIALSNPDAFEAMKANGLKICEEDVSRQYPFPTWLAGKLQNDPPTLQMFAKVFIARTLSKQLAPPVKEPRSRSRRGHGFRRSSIQYGRIRRPSEPVTASVAAEYCTAPDGLFDVILAAVDTARETWPPKYKPSPPPALEMFVTALCAQGGVPVKDFFARLHCPISAATVRPLVEKGADVNAQRTSGWGILQHNLNPIPGWRETADALLSCGLNLEAVGAEGHTLLMEVPYDCVRPLLDLGADIHVRDAAGDSVLTRMAKQGRLVALREFIKDGRVDPNVPDSNFLLPFVLANTGLPCIEPLLRDTRTNVDSVNEEGVTATMVAAGLGLQKALQLLLERKPDLSAVDAEGRTCLAHAVQSQKIAVCGLLLRAGAAVGGGKVCALEEAVMLRDLAMCNMLLRVGADATRRCADGSRLLEYVTRVDMRKALVKHGAVEGDSDSDSDSDNASGDAEDAEDTAAADTQHTDTKVAKKRAREDTPEAVQTCRECAPPAAGEVFASADVLRRHVTQHHDMQWSEYVTRHDLAE